MAFRLSSFFELEAELTSPLDLSTPTSLFKFAQQINLAQGAGVDQADKIWHDSRSLAASGTENLDLSGVLADPFGASILFARIKGIILRTAKANTNNVVLGNSGVNAFLGPFGAAAHTLAVRPGGLLVLFAPDATGYVVTPATGDILTVTNSAAGSSVSYDIALVGAAS